MEIIEKINYPVELIEIQRWVEGDNVLLFVNTLEPEKPPRIKPTGGLILYDEEFYKGLYNKQSAIQFMKYSKEVEKIIRKNGWDLKLKYNKHYCGYKAGFYNAFGIKWLGSKSFAFFFKLDEEEAKELNSNMYRYESQWKEANYLIEPGVTKVEDFIPLFSRAYTKLTGNK